jgi:selenocysteine lyase/cysteine desulfurase|nr:aminotransferase class V-fold PLP-dependent enzyme [Pseudomonas yamanorum]
MNSQPGKPAVDDRRSFLKKAGLLAAGLQLQGCVSATARTDGAAAITGSTRPATPDDWQQVRGQFNIDTDWTHLAGFLITSHPRMVRDDIAAHRDRIDRNPAEEMDYLNIWRHEDDSRAWAARYLGVQTPQIALTGSTTEGIGLIYNGLVIHPGQEVLTSEHEHYATKGALSFRAERDGTRIKTIRLFKDPHTVTADEVLDTLSRNISAKTRVLAMTWVHSGSGIKMPIAEIGKLVDERNRSRGEKDRIIFCVDGVHGFGVENVNFADLNCDYFMAGTHKWIFGPRGTGIICSRNPQVQGLIPTFESFSASEDFGTTMTPGGYHAFEHQWALRKAFEFHLQLGKDRVATRIHQLNSEFKEHLQQVRGVQLVTPASTELSAGFTFFRVKDVAPETVAHYLKANKVIADATDRDVGPLVRTAPGLLNDSAQLQRVARLLAEAPFNRKTA